jgi:Glycosyltransferase family 9 (heptosyltransferase)
MVSTPASPSPAKKEAAAFLPSVLRRLGRRLYWARSDAGYWHQLRQIRCLVYLGGGGIGDSLNCSAVIHEMHRRPPGMVSMMTPHPDMFQGNPEVHSLHPYDYELTVALRRWGRPVHHPIYEIPRDQPPRRPTVNDHLISQLCRSVGLTGDVALRPYFFFHPGEKERFSSYRDAVIVQSSCVNARHMLPAKNWPVDRMQQVVSMLRSQHRIVQTGHRDDERLDGAEDLRGRLSLREVAALLANSRFLVGLVGFLMHLARAVDTRAVIVYGGREHPLQSGYIANENIIGEAPCAPCGITDACKIGHGCMTQITPAHVLDAVERLQARLASPLETAVVNLN